MNSRTTTAVRYRIPLTTVGMGRALIGFGALALVGGCGTSDGPGALYVDPAHYNFYHCDNLAKERQDLIQRENELRGFIEKAGETTEGAVIGSFAYRSDYESVLTKEKLLQRIAVEKKCSRSQSE
jgi:hypothetical protein